MFDKLQKSELNPIGSSEQNSLRRPRTKVRRRNTKYASIAIAPTNLPRRADNRTDLMAPPTTIDDDPVIATYSVYLTPPPPLEDPPRSLLIQYPDRNIRRPYGPATHQTPLAFRLKPNTGLVELDVPIDTEHNYNRARGSTYASALQQSRILTVGGSHGLAGGFNTGPGGRPFRADEDADVDMNSIPRHGLDDERELKFQTLGGKIAKSTDGDPLYMLGTFRGTSLHLTHLDSIVQVRPQLHHLDAADEIARGATSKPLKKGETEKSETRAVEIKVKSSDEKNADRTRKRTNAEMLTEIQSEPWQTYAWLDSSNPDTAAKFGTQLLLDATGQDTETLTSALSPSSYLDSISAPRVDLALSLSSNPHAASKLGLMSKIRGRERERRRRKKNDAERKAAAAEEAARRTAEAVQNGEIPMEEAKEYERSLTEELESRSGTESSSGDDEDENEAVIDDGGPGTVPSSAKNPGTQVPMEEAEQVKRPRGRPKKSTTEVKLEPPLAEPMVLD